MKDFVIIGGGIGGLTTALALRQTGHNVHVYESATSLDPVGAGIIMANNAMQVFEHLGVREAIQAAGQKISFVKLTDAQLREIVTSDLRPFESFYGVHNLSIHRAALQRVLADAVGMEFIHLGKRLKTLIPGSPNRLVFEDGEVVEAAAVIGADGIRSVVRQQLFPSSQLRDAKQLCWRGITTDRPLQSSALDALECWGAGKRFGFSKVGNGQLYWFAVANADLVKGEEDVHRLFTEFHPDIQALIQQTDRNQIIFNDLKDLKHLAKWSEGSCCLLGDAAHATTPNLGQGACQAVEDAYVLGKLSAQNLSVEELFKKFERLRKPKARFIVNTSYRMGQVAHFSHPLAVLLRNAFFRSVPKFIERRQLARIFGINDFS